MKSSLALTLLGLTLLMAGTIIVANSSSFSKNPQNLSLSSSSSTSNLTTVRGWNTCVNNKVPIACSDVSNKHHQECYFALVDTTNCLLLDEQVCIDFFTFTQESANLDATLPETFQPCVQACTPEAEEESHFYQWYNLKYNICSQAS